MNMFEYYLKFVSKNIHKLANEVLLSYYDEEIFNKIIKKYFEIRYYNYYDEKNIEDSIEKNMNNFFADLLEGNDDENIIKMYMAFNYIIMFDNYYNVSDQTVIKLLTNYRKEINIEENKIFPKNMLKIINSFKEKEENFYKYFDSDVFTLSEEKTSKDNIINIIMKYNITFPDIYSKEAVNEIFNNNPISSEKLIVEYLMITSKILVDIKNFDYKRYYLLDFSCELFSNGELLEKIKKVTNSDMFKFKGIFKITYNDYSKYETNIKDLIRQGYQFAIIIDDDVEINNNSILSYFKNIIIDFNSKYISYNNDRIIVVGD